MYKALFFIAFFCSSLISAYAQTDTLLEKGKYYNTNVFIFNPETDSGYSIRAIIVNDDTLKDDLQTNGIEVDLSQLSLKQEDEVVIQIIYSQGHKPSVVNPEALQGPVKLRFSKPKYYKGKLQWRVSGSLSDYPIIIEEYRWNDWRVMGEVDPLDTVKNHFYQYEIHVHSGLNLVRLTTTNLQGEKVVSKELRFTPSRIPKVNLQSTKVKDDITFSSETDYELYDMNGNLVKKGTERYVDVRDLPKGEYWLNFDNETVKIKIK